MFYCLNIPYYVSEKYDLIQKYVSLLLMPDIKIYHILNLVSILKNHGVNIWNVRLT